LGEAKVGNPLVTNTLCSAFEMISIDKEEFGFFSLCSERSETL